MERFHIFNGLIGIFSYTNHLLGLKATNVKRKFNNKMITIPKTGYIGDNVKDSDVLFCDLTSVDSWIKIRLKLHSSIKSLFVSLEMKVDRNLTLLYLRNVIQKLSISVWNNACQQEDNPRYLFVLHHITLSTVELIR